MPALFKFAKDHEKDKSRFVILTMHGGGGVDTIAELEPKLKPLLQRWSIARFPFPILMDKSGQFNRDWQIRGYPTAFLINPEGLIVAEGHGGIEERLAEELKKPAGSGEKPKTGKP
ncbi:MAG: TlpA family protein disulfide reductase [Phycisphaerales bacterium]|nr:TlpA family protein disulfide reductase [Phycisphaerales bacterium]